MGLGNSTNDLTSLSGMVFGMPPGTHYSDKIMYNSMPTANIIPCEPEFSRGLSLFRLDQQKGWREYNKILNSVGFSTTGNAIKVAYLADNFPTDTFNNEYGETFLDKFAQVASSGLGDVAQIMGWSSFDDVSEGMGNIADATGLGGAASSAATKGKEMFNNANAKLSKPNQSRLGSVMNTMKSLATGARVDFPQVWKNSQFTPSYSMTIRLYNPDPSNPESTRKYIVGPIAALVALGVPKVAEDASTYKWPLLCKVRSPGIYHLNAAFINSIAIIKGGDQQSIAFNQSMAMCDVRIDFGSLYNSILAGPGTNEMGIDRPTLGSYLEAIGGSAVTSSAGRRETFSLKTKEQKIKRVEEGTPLKKSAPIKRNETNINEPTSRVSVSQKDIEDELRRASGI